MMAPVVKTVTEGSANREVDAQGDAGKTAAANSSNPVIELSEPKISDDAWFISAVNTVVVGRR